MRGGGAALPLSAFCLNPVVDSSQTASYDYSREAQIGFIDELLAHLDVQEKITLVVHDIGGIMGVPWAARNVNRLHAVIYTNTVAFPGFRWFNLARRWGRDGVVGRGVGQLSMAALGWFGGRLFRSVFAKQNPQLSKLEMDRFVRDFALNPVAKATTLCEFRSVTRPDFFDGCDQMLKSISASVPTMALWGEGDPYLANRFASDLFAQKTIMLPEVGHWVPIIAAATLAEHIRSLHGIQEGQP